MNTEHKQISVFNPFFGEYTEVDEGISELIEVLWSLGIKVFSWFEDNQYGIVWIAFHSLRDYEEFLNALAFVDYSLFLNVIVGEENWSTYIYPHNSNEKLDEDKDEFVSTGPANILCWADVSFPKEMYSRILAMMKTFLLENCQQEHLSD